MSKNTVLRHFDVAKVRLFKYEDDFKHRVYMAICKTHCVDALLNYVIYFRNFVRVIQPIDILRFGDTSLGDLTIRFTPAAIAQLYCCIYVSCFVCILVVIKGQAYVIQRTTDWCRTVIFRTLDYSYFCYRVKGSKGRSLLSSAVFLSLKNDNHLCKYAYTAFVYYIISINCYGNCNPIWPTCGKNWSTFMWCGALKCLTLQVIYSGCYIQSR